MPGRAFSGQAVGVHSPLLAVDVGGTDVKAEVLDAAGHVVVDGRAPTDTGTGALDAVVALGRDLVEKARASGVVVERAGVVVPGLVDPATGVVRLAANVRWPSPSVAQDLADGLSLQVVLGHDVAAAGLAEHRLGAGRGVDDVVVVAVGTGIAATIVSGGRVLTGGRTADGRVGQAGELGHLRVPSAGERLCGCGQLGCLETLASARAIARDYTELSGQSVAGADEVVARLAEDPLAQQVWERAVQGLAEGLLAACVLVAPSRVVVAGGLSAAGEVLLTPLREAMDAQSRIAVVPDLVTASLGTRAGVIGAALLAADEAATVFAPTSPADAAGASQAVS